MRFYNRIEAVCRMNRLGAERRPFLFVIDYKQEQVIVEDRFGGIALQSGRCDECCDCKPYE